MLESIKEWGDFAKSQVSEESSSELKSKNVTHALTILIQLDENNASYKEIRHEEIDPSKRKRYLYRKKTSRGPNYTPAAIITEPEKTFKNKILNWYKEKINSSDSFKKIYNVLKENEEQIINNIKEKIKYIKKKKNENILLTLKFLENGAEKYLGDYDEYKKILNESIKERQEKVSSWGISKRYGKCFLCGRESDVYGFAVSGIFPGFATVDKPGFAPNLDREAYVNYMPICSSCADSLRIGKEFIEEYLAFSFKDIGIKYLVIPYVLNEDIRNEIFNKLINKKYKGEQYTEGLLSEEDYLSDMAKEYNDIFTLSFLFYLEQQSRWIIKSFIEDVAPSWLRKIYDAQNEIKNNIFSEDTMKKIFGKKYEGSLFHGSNWYIRFMEDLCNKNKDELVFFISSILWKKRISNAYLHSIFMQKLRQDFYEDDRRLRENTLKSFAILRFLEKIFIEDNYILNSDYSMSNEDLGFEKFFKEHNITDSWKKATFAVGVLVRYVLNIQKEKRSSEPFKSKLRGLMIDDEYLKKLFKESINKIFEYDCEYKTLQEIVGKYLTESEGKFPNDIDEISYYFTLGLTLGNTFIYKKI
jgi:CRISPR-associated protein Csh1